MKKHFTIVMALALVAALVSACALPGVSGPTSPASQSVANGKVEFWVTDAPRTDNVSEIWVHVTEVQIHKADQDGDGEDDGEWISANITGPNPFELLALRNGGTSGIQQVLASANITPGKYTQIRMTIDNVQVKIDGVLKDAILPSGKLKFVHPFEVAEWSTTKLLFDFDADKFVDTKGESGRIMVKPVIKLIVEKPKPTEGAVKITTPSLPNGGVGVAYNATLVATGGTLPYTWSLLSGTLPAGLALNAGTGNITGTPTTADNYTFTIQVSDNSTPVKSNTKEYKVTIAAAGALIITTTSLPDGQEGTAYPNTQLLAIGGTLPYAWTIISGNFPEGMALNSGGLISGTPTKNGNFNFTVQVSDNSTPTVKTDTQPLSIKIQND